MQALAQRKDAASADLLERRAAIEPLPNLAWLAKSSAESIRNAPAEDLSQLRKQLDNLQKENTDLKTRIERLENR